MYSGLSSAPFLFPLRDASLTWTSTLPTTDKPGEGTIGIGQLPALRVRTRMPSPDRPVEVLLKDGRIVALLTLGPPGSNPAPTTNYNALASQVSAAIKLHVYDPDLATSSQVRGYVEDLAAGAARATDDLEFLFAAGISGRTHIKFSQPLVYRPGNPAAESTLYSAYPAIASPQQVSFNEKTRIATLRVDAFMQADSVDQAFEEILSKHPRGIILDLHTCAGVQIASLRGRGLIIDQPTDAGTFFGRDRARRRPCTATPPASPPSPSATPLPLPRSRQHSTHAAAPESPSRQTPTTSPAQSPSSHPTSPLPPPNPSSGSSNSPAVPRCTARPPPAARFSPAR